LGHLNRARNAVINAGDWSAAWFEVGLLFLAKITIGYLDI